MSTPFYDLASLVVVPSGYKASKVYAQKPLTTDGQLAFSRASTATRVNASGLIETVSSNVPRLDYLGSTCPKLLLEPQRVNLALQSSAIDNAAWIKGNSPIITTNIATAPDGTTSADGIQDSTGGSYKTIAQNISLSANSTLTLSFFVKKETSETAFGGFTMYFQGSTAKIVYGIVNAVTGAVTYASSTLTPTTKVEDYGTYWRIASTATDNGSNTLCSIGYYGTLSANGTSLSPAIGSVRTVWGFQAEIGAYATSYIPTLGAAVTRGADVASITDLTSKGIIPSSSSFTAFFELELLGNETPDDKIRLTDSDAVPRAYLYRSTAGVTAWSNTENIDMLTNNKIAYTANSATSISFYENGSLTETFTDTGANPLTFERLSLSGSNGAFLVKQLILFPSALTPAQLAELTA